MKVFIASDHAGFKAKQELIRVLSEEKIGIELIDLGPEKLDPEDDYPVYAKKVAEVVAIDKQSRGILVCGSGQGMAIAANKFKGIRASVAWNEEVARETRADNDSNVLSLPSRFIKDSELFRIVGVWLETPFSTQERHQRRIEEINKF